MGFFAKLKEKLFNKKVKEEVKSKYVSGLDKSRKNFVDKLAELKAQLKEITSKLSVYAEEISEIRKKEAKKLGWKPILMNLHQVTDKGVIGGDIYKNTDGKLPSSNGRIWYEADINYTGGMRNSSRILYSNDGLIFVTYDHYFTFNQIC